MIDKIKGSELTLTSQKSTDVTHPDKELDKEKSESSSTSTSSVSLETKEDEQDTRFEPIVKPATAGGNLRLSRETLRAASLRRERSNNGYGVDELDVDASPGLEEAQDANRKSSILLENGAGSNNRTEAEKIDPYEVRWEGGDSDPLNPRSMSLLRKWVIVGITSFGSLCV